MRIAVLLTCFNRKQKTISCLKSLFDASDNYDHNLDLHLFITDDGCTDGTAAAVRATFPNSNITIIRGDGNLFWARGMIAAWKEAMGQSREWDFYLLINDDTIMLPNLFYELFSVHEFSLNNYSMGGIYSGITCAMDNPQKVTYGGDMWVEGSYSKTIRLEPSGVPQICDMANANIFLVDRTVVEKIGIFYPYGHSCADNDYTIQARKKGIPVLVTGFYCGKCDNDHKTEVETRTYLQSLSLKQRKAYFKSPLHSNRDKIIFTKRNMPSRLPLVCIGRMIDLYCPSLYTVLKKIKL